MTKSGIGWIAVLFSCLCQTSAVDWVKVPVPGRHDFKGYGWYRTWFKPPQRFFAKHERDLWGESVIFNVRGLAGAHEVYVNGKRTGGGGNFPPEFEDGRKGNHQHKVPSGSLVPEAWNQLAVRVYAPDGGGGFLGEAPFLMNYFLECVFDGPWEFRPGDARVSFDGVLDRRPSGSAFDQFRESNRVLAEAERFVHGHKLPPLDSFRKMKAADDLVVELMLAEPLVAQPTHFSFDSRGRLWVSQFRQYPFPAGLEDDQPGPLLPLALRRGAGGAPASRPRTRSDLHPRGHHGRRQVRPPQGLSGRLEHGQRGHARPRRGVGDAHPVPALLSRPGLRRRPGRAAGGPPPGIRPGGLPRHRQRTGLGNGRLALWDPRQHHGLPT